MSPALVLQLSVLTDSSAVAAGLSSPYGQEASSSPVPAATPVDASLGAGMGAGVVSHEQAALWEATLVAVGLVVGAAALCVALLVAAYGLHSRVARCCRGRVHGSGSSIHSKSSSVEPLNAPDQNNV